MAMAVGVAHTEAPLLFVDGDILNLRRRCWA
jgi:hypothetical protein